MGNTIEGVTKQIIQTLDREGHPDKAVLAGLRNAATLTNQRAQTVWPTMLANLDRNMLSRDGQPTYAETAIYAALRFYAIQQQGQTQLVYGPVYGDDETKGRLLFSALGELRHQETLQVALDRRIKALLATTNVPSMINSLSHLVSSLKAHHAIQRIDYAALAQDLYAAQFGNAQANRVHLRWGQQYFWNSTTTKTEGKQN